MQVINIAVFKTYVLFKSFNSELLPFYQYKHFSLKQILVHLPDNFLISANENANCTNEKRSLKMIEHIFILCVSEQL